MGAIDTAIGAGLGMITGAYQDRRQVRQQGKLMELQLQGQKDMANYNQNLAYDMWDKTNYKAQVEQLKKAGLNTGLMYAKGGTGGTTQIPGGAVGGATAQGGVGEIGMGLQYALQKEMQQAQIEVAKSQANLNNTQAAKLGGVDTLKTTAETNVLGETLNSIKQNINNAKAQEALTKYQTELTKTQSEVAGRTAEQVIESISNANARVEQEIRSLTNSNEITEATKETVIQQIKTASIEQGLRITAQKAGVKLTEEQTKKVSAEIGKIANDTLNNWRSLDQNQQRITIEKIMMDLKTQQVEFDTSTPEQIRQWTSIITDLIPLAGKKK